MHTGLYMDAHNTPAPGNFLCDNFAWIWMANLNIGDFFVNLNCRFWIWGFFPVWQLWMNLNCEFEFGDCEIQFENNPGTSMAALPLVWASDSRGMKAMFLHGSNGAVTQQRGPEAGFLLDRVDHIPLLSRTRRGYPTSRNLQLFFLDHYLSPRGNITQAYQPLPLLLLLLPTPPPNI